MSGEPILVADIGGTNARFAIARRSAAAIELEHSKRYPAREFEHLSIAASAYLNEAGVAAAGACFAVAGPAHREEIRFTNSPWRFRPDDVRAELGLPNLRIVNDFEALAAGVAFLPDAAFVEIKKGRGDARAPTLVIGPGTGLGQALIVPTDAGDRIVATEGGHVAFAPETEDEFELMRFIGAAHGRASVERLISGEGLVTIYRALCAADGAEARLDRPGAVADAAREDSCSVSRRAVDLFCEVFGRVAGDAVLACGARGGVVIGGGVAPRIRDLLVESRFVEAFLDKGRMRDYVDGAPIRLIVDGDAALYGAMAAGGFK